METEEITKLVDGIYKNILEKFNPGARQLINAGKAYLKALHGAAAASRIYLDTIAKLARQAQQGTWGASSDIGTALGQVVEVHKEIQNQQLNILKAFYVDLLVPLETNLEKDTKVVQSEQKRFLQHHKQRSETFTKAAATMKKQRKKNKGPAKTGEAMNKEIKNLQAMEEEKTKLDAFCEQSLKMAMTQERRRYGFVLERQCSLAKHYLAYHALGSTSLQRHLDTWQEVAGTREFLPSAVESALAGRLRQVTFWPEEDPYTNPHNPEIEDDRASVSSQLRKTRSMDASAQDIRCVPESPGPLKPLTRAKSDFNLAASTTSLLQGSPIRPKSMATPNPDPQMARAMYAYISSGENQLSFLEGDIITIIGERNKGWQFGENLRTQATGWFPLAYTDVLHDDSSSGSPFRSGDWSGSSGVVTTPTNGLSSSFAPSPESSSSSSGAAAHGHVPPSSGAGGGGGAAGVAGKHDGRPGAITMFGDTLLLRGAQRKVRRGTATPASPAPPPPMPPPPQPAPVPAPRIQANHHHAHLSHTLPAAAAAAARGGGNAVVGKRGGGGGSAASGSANGAATGSLHSSNDSGFSNEPPPQPEVDYSDEECSSPKRGPTASPSGLSIAPGLSGSNTGKKKLLNSVRGWLLYKSALDLWDDVNQQQSQQLHPYAMATLPPKKRQHAFALPERHPAALRQASSVGHLATLGRLSLPKTAFASHDTLAAGMPTSTRTLERPPLHPINGDGGGTLVKRSKSIWKFMRPKENVLEGMSLWQHRSLVDVHAAVEEEVKSKGKEKVGGPVSLDVSRTLPRAAPPPGPVVGPPHPKDLDDDGLRLPRSLSSEADESGAESCLGEEDLSECADAESCIVVDDHRRATASSLKKKLPRKAHLPGGNGVLPRTRLAKALALQRQRQNQQRANEEGASSPASDGAGDGLLRYGRSLQQRLSKPDRGARFDEKSETTGNRCGPWYDLWGVDATVKR